MEDSLALLEEENDEEMREMAKEELSGARNGLRIWSMSLRFSCFQKSPNDDKNIILEIRAGAGGDEAALFAAEHLPHVFKLCGQPEMEGGDCQPQWKTASAVSRK